MSSAQDSALVDSLMQRFTAAILNDELQRAGAQTHLHWFLPDLGSGAWFVSCNMAEFDRALTRWEARKAVALPCWLDTAKLLHKCCVKWMPLAEVQQLTEEDGNTEIVHGIRSMPAECITVVLAVFPGAVVATNGFYCRVVGVREAAGSAGGIPEWCQTVISTAGAYIPGDALMSALFQAARHGAFDPRPFMLVVETARANTCRRCGAAGNKICAGCGVEKYCSIACQRASWPKHQHVCARDKAVFAFAVTMLHTLGPEPARNQQN